MNNAKLLHIFFVFSIYFQIKPFLFFFFFCNSVLSFLYIKCRMVRRTLKNKNIYTRVYFGSVHCSGVSLGRGVVGMIVGSR